MNFASFFLSTVPFLIQLFYDKDVAEDRTATQNQSDTEFNLPNPKIYDFIVVGGGTAGCVVASRLSEKYNVLLIEAGGNPPPVGYMPNFVGFIASAPTINYFFKSVMQKDALYETNGINIKSMGKMLGGSSSHNGIVYNRGSPFDYDNWARITNDASWSYKNILQYYKKSEDYISSRENLNTFKGQHGKGGVLTVDSESLPLWLDAGQELGYNLVGPNGPQAVGFTPTEITRQFGRRVSTYDAFIKPFEGSRKTLTVERYATVSEILMTDCNRAYGVAYKRHGIPQIAHASKEIIVSAGTFGSAVLLMKSGIGPASTLQAANIKQVMELPVGKNLQDHPSVAIGPIFLKDSSSLPTVKRNLTEESVKDFLENGRGILSAPFIAPQAYLVSSRAIKEGNPNWPDIQLVLSVYDDESDNGNISLFINVIDGRPKNRGQVTLDGIALKDGVQDPSVLARIDYQFLKESSDIIVLLEGIDYALKIVENTTSFQNVGAMLSPTPLRFCDKFVFRSEAYWRCYIRQKAIPWSHITSTCSMGYGPQDPNAVLDSKLRVIGVKGLRVADASIMPAVTNSNTAAPSIMIGEKAAAEILKSWEYK